MWQPHQLPSIAKKLQRAGLALAPKKLTQLTEFPMGAIISLGGCTASFVSPKGLVVTNYHCVYGSLQYNSTPKKNILNDGFLAKKINQELPSTPGSRIYVTESIQSVTKQIKQDLKEKMSGSERFKHIAFKRKQLIAECEGNKNYRCQVVQFHGGLEYFLFKQLMIRDVRLVYAPAQSIGKFGGDIDNWMWPRHTGDYGFYRAYVNKKGEPADYSKDNVPYQPKHYLKINAKGIAENDYIMVIGYPGSTHRYRTALEVKQTFQESYPLTKEVLGSIIQIIQSHSKKGSAPRLKYQSLLASLANYEKNRRSMIYRYHHGSMQKRKESLENSLNQWIQKSKTRKKKYTSVIKKLNSLVEKNHQHYQRNTFLGYMRLSSMLQSATTLYRLAIEKQKKDIDREIGYQKRDLKSITQKLKRIDQRYDPKIDQAILMYLLSRYSKQPQQEHIKSIDRFFHLDKNWSHEKRIHFIEKMYANTQLNQQKNRLQWMKRSVEDFKKSHDPFIQYAVKTYEARKKLEEDSKTHQGNLNAIRPHYMQALMAYYQSKNKAIYPDANSTLRVTYGHVKGYSFKDGLKTTSFTTLEGLLEKATEKEPFRISKKQRDLIEKKFYGKYLKKDLGSVPVNFLGTLDITGGNSGSPTLNAKGELVGLVFDKVYESIIGDWDYDAPLNRSISVDIRYMLWVMEYVDNATSLINEMDIQY
jgi:hypothetical protein